MENHIVRDLLHGKGNPRNSEGAFATLADGRLLFAHSDLSGYSVFEEAAWWGDRAGRKALGS